ncbi:MAG TPA: hypothetical protein VGB22_03415 [candidate division Zixibacteria bacterium]
MLRFCRHMKLAAPGLCALLLSIGCGDSNFEKVDKSQVSDASHPPTTEETKLGIPQPPPMRGDPDKQSTAGVEWQVPAEWGRDRARPMRAATYLLGVEGHAAECGVFFFGEGQGGEVQDNIDRWIGQFSRPDGSDPKDAAIIQTRTVNDLSVTSIELTGTYNLSMGGPANSRQVPMAGYKLIGAIVEAPQGPLFFKLVGPADVVDEGAAAFWTMIESVRRY